MSEHYRLRTLPVGFELQPGFHGAPEEGMCALEAVAWMAGLPHSDQPPCICPVIATLLRAMNDRMTHFHRQGLIPFLPRIAGTKQTDLDRPRAEALAWRALTVFVPVPLAVARLLEPAAAFTRLPGDDLEAAARTVGQATVSINQAAWAEAKANGSRCWDITAKVSEPLWVSVEVGRLAETAVSQLAGDCEPSELATTAARIIVAACRFDRSAWRPALETLDRLLEIRLGYGSIQDLEEVRGRPAVRAA